MLVLCHLQLPMDENPNQTGLSKTRQEGLSQLGPWEALRLQHGRQRLSSAQWVCFLSVRTPSRGPEKWPGPGTADVTSAHAGDHAAGDHRHPRMGVCKSQESRRSPVTRTCSRRCSLKGSSVVMCVTYFQVQQISNA